jgi:1,4-alpha-glucan branching enzyme
MTHKHKAEPRKLVFSKIFRWQPPAGHPETPTKVEVVGTFNHWYPQPMTRDVSGGWSLTLHDIPGNRTHHYMFLADGKPVSDKHSDGYAVPHGHDEEKYAIAAARGPRVFMLFAQTK